ncbi:MAG: hypothetical protein ABII64_03410 [Elusimicrobiota bacterium]
MTDLGIFKLIIDILLKVIGWFVKHFKKPDSSEIIQLRQKWKNEIISRIDNRLDSHAFSEAIIRDASRMDEYPNTDEKAKGISPWFRVGIAGTYHRGLEVILRILSVNFVDELDKWRFSSKDEKEYTNCYLIGRIPFDRIVNIDWDGDEFYNIPHIYCRFLSKDREPYEELVLSKKHEFDNYFHFSELQSYYETVKITKKLKIDSHEI